MWIDKSKNKWLNELWCGDNLDALKNIPDESVDMIYIDPPFFSNKDWEIIWGNGAERRAFEDHWRGGINHYVDYMSERFDEMKRILKPSGSIFVHLDWHASHYIKCALDKIFEYKNFRNEIAWCYSRMATKGQKWFNRNHDVIFWYQKTDEAPFYVDSVRMPYAEGSKSRAGYKKTSLGGGSPKSGICELNTIGKFPEDWWIDIPFIRPNAKERIGYPTQKPEALLERIIKATTKEGDVVLDAFCGCGTTIAVAERLNRKWIGIDVSPIAVKVMTERLIIMEKKLGKKLEDFITFGLPEETVAHIKKMSGSEFEDFIIQQIGGKASARKVHDYGIDGYTSEGIPIQAKDWANSVGRNVVDNFQSAIRRDHKKKGQIYALKFAKGAYEEVARVKREDGIEIDLISMQDFLIEKYGDHTHRK